MVKQLSIFVQNRSGKLAASLGVLRDNGIDIRALTIADTPDFGILRLLVDDAAKAETVLYENGFLVQCTDVVVVPVLDERGGLATLLEPMAEAGVNIEYMYSLIARDARTPSWSSMWPTTPPSSPCSRKRASATPRPKNWA